MKKKLILVLVNIIFLIVFLLHIFSIYSKNNTLEIHIGYQSVTSQTWGALIVKEKNFYYEKLKEKYPDKTIKIVWHDEMSGAIINTNMISGKVQFGFMGDMPMLLNFYKSETIDNYNSYLIAFDGKGKDGVNQSIVVSKKSNIRQLTDLKGKTISTPIGSSAHFMLMRILEENKMLDDVEIVHQDVALASQLLNTKKTDAFAIWAPYPVFLEEKELGRVLVDGSNAKCDYLAGVVADKTWADNNKEKVELFLKSLEEAHEFIENNPDEAIKIFNKQSGFSIDTVKQSIKNIKWDTAITDVDFQSMILKQEFLVELDQLKNYELSKYINYDKENY